MVTVAAGGCGNILGARRKSLTQDSETACGICCVSQEKLCIKERVVTVFGNNCRPQEY